MELWPQGSVLLGTWAQLHPNYKVDVSAPYAKAREDFQSLPEAVLWQNPAHLETLEDQYLTMPDGGCCLPVAYVLGFAYREKGRITDWAEKLDDRVDALPPMDDRVVNWLIARALAEEMRFGRTGRFSRPAYRSLAGKGWLESALMAASTESTRLRVYREILWRLTSRQRFEAARALLDEASQRLTGPASVAKLAAWRAEIDELPDRVETQQADADRLAKNAYLQSLRDRYQKAVSAGRQGEVTRYRERLAAEGVDVD